jgi:hypothetical protein
LQSLLDSLGSGIDDSSGSEAESGIASTGTAPANASANTSVENSTLPAGAASGLRQPTIAISETRSAAEVVSVGVPAEASVTRTTGAQLASTKIEKTEKAEEKKPKTEPEKASESSSQTNQFVSTTAPEAVTTAELPTVVPAEIASLAPVAALPFLADSSTTPSNSDGKVDSVQTALTQTSLTQTALAVDLPSGSAAASLSPRAVKAKDAGDVAATAAGTAHEPAQEEEESPAQTRQLAKVPDTSGQTGTSRNAAESTHAQKDALPAAAKLSEGANAVVTPVLDSNSNQPLVPSMISSQAVVQDRQDLPIQARNDTVPETTTVKTAVHSDGLNLSPTAVNTAATQSSALQIDPSSSATTAAGKSSSASGGKGAATGLSKTTRVAGNSEAVSSGRALAVQSSVSVADASEMARDLAGERGGAGTTGEPARTMATGPDTREAFATLDSGSTTGRPTWIHTGSERAEAGYQDPSLGWVSVRADASGGGVHAEVVAGSADAAQALGSHMAGLNAYLAEHHTPVETLTVSSPESGWTGMGSDKGTGGHGAGQQSGQAEQGTDAGSASGSYSERATQPVAAAQLAAMRAGINGSALSTGQGGVHISVMA